MLGLFGTLNLAARSMQAQMTGVEVSGHNLANVNNPAYTRQRVVLETNTAIPTGIGMEGTGVKVAAIQQIVSTLLNGQIQTQSGVGSYWSTQQNLLQSAQNGLNEFLNSSGSTDATSSTSTATTANSSLSTLLTGFFNDFSAVASSDTPGNRQKLVGDAQSLAQAFNGATTQISTARTAANTSITNDVDSANKLLADVASLNTQISRAEFTGGEANDLRDSRQQDLENLAKITNFTTSTGTNNTVNISIGGQTLVSGQNVQDTLQAYDASSSGGGQWLIRTATGQVPLTLTSGSIQGAIDVRDGALTDLQTNINSLATTVISQVNTLHNAGFNSTGGNGNTFFTGSNAATISVNASLVNDPSLVQTASTSTASGDTSVALAIAQLANSSQTALGGQTFSQAYSQIVGHLGDSVKTANDQVDGQTAVAAMLTTQRSSVSGVSLDEEMTNMMSFQKAYTASAEVVKTVDAMLQTVLAMKT